MKLFQTIINKKSNFILLISTILVLLLGGLLRFWHLGTLLQGFHNDEVMNGYVGRFILENGVDLYGNHWPLVYIDNFGDYPNVMPMYLSGLSTFLFGTTVFAVRFPIALMGTLSILIVFLFARWLYTSPWVAVFSALTLAIMPWHIVLSRATAEGITAATVGILGIFLISISFEKSELKKLFFGWILLLFTYLLYPGFRVLAPLIFLPTFLLSRDKKMQRVCVILAVVLFAITFMIGRTDWGKGRYEQTSIVSHNNIISGRSINYSLGLGQNRVLEARIFHNKYVLIVREILTQYMSYFSTDFLASRGGMPRRYLVPEHGVLYWSLLGIVALVLLKHLIDPWNKEYLLALFKNHRSGIFLWLMWILFVSPLPAALTLDDVPNVHRASFMTVILAVLFGSAWSLLADIKVYKKGILTGIFLVAIGMETVYFWHFYSNLASIETSLYRKDEQSALAHQLSELKSKYDAVYVPKGEGLSLHYLFMNGDFSYELSQRFEPGLKLSKIDNIVLLDENCPTNNLPESFFSENSLVINRSNCDFDAAFKSIGVIRHFNELPAYSLLIKNDEMER